MGHKYNWVKNKANAISKKKIDYLEIDDRYVLAGLFLSDLYTDDEKSENAKKLESAEKKLLTYKLPANQVEIEEYVWGSDHYDNILRTDFFEAIQDEYIYSWNEYAQDKYHEYGESEYGVTSFVEEVIIKDTAGGEKQREKLKLFDIFSFPRKEMDQGRLSKMVGYLIHEAISHEVGDWDYPEFTLEWEFRPEYLTPVFSDAGRAVTNYAYHNPSTKWSDYAEIEGELIESDPKGTEIKIYMVKKDDLIEIDFRRSGKTQRITVLKSMKTMYLLT